MRQHTGSIRCLVHVDGTQVFTAEKGKRTRVFTVEKKEYRCLCMRKGRTCNRLIGKGRPAGFETVCPKCGATLKLTESGVTIIKTAKR